MDYDLILGIIGSCKVDEKHKSNWPLFHKYIGEIKLIPETSGVYLFYSITLTEYNFKILYIGSATNLRKRVQRHEIIKVLRNLDYGLVFTRVHFCPKDEMLKLEKKLIQELKPTINIQYNS